MERNIKMSQPKWKIIGGVGDINPLDFDGGFVYIDETGIYDPEIVYFEPASDEQWEKFSNEGKEDELPVLVYRVIIENDSSKEWWYKDLDEIQSYAGWSKESLKQVIKERNPLHMAALYMDLIRYYGAEEFDSYPIKMTVKEAEEKYKDEFKFVRK
jgi:hypothetical protein